MSPQSLHGPHDPQEELARRYRQRLAWYPRAYRRAHEEEMLGVLLEGARPGQEFPSLAESADLIWGALRIRMRLGARYPGNIGSDALAVFSLLAPLLLLGPVLATLALHLLQAGPAPAARFRVSMPVLFQHYDERVALVRGLSLALAGQLAVAAGAVLRLRYITLAAIAVILAWWILDPREGFQAGGGVSDLLLTCYLLEAVALIASPGPRRGLQLLAWKSGAVLLAAAALLTATWTLSMRWLFSTAFTSGGDASANVDAIVALAALAAAVALFSQLGRYVVVLFAAVFYPYPLFLAQMAEPFRIPFRGTGVELIILYAPPLLAICVIVALAYRRPREGVLRSPSGTGTRA